MTKFLRSLGFANAVEGGRLQLDWPECPVGQIRGVVHARRSWVIPPSGAASDPYSQPNVIADLEMLAETFLGAWRDERPDGYEKRFDWIVSWRTIRIMARLACGEPLVMAAEDGDRRRLGVLNKLLSGSGLPIIGITSDWVPDRVVIAEGAISSGRRIHQGSGASILVATYR